MADPVSLHTGGDEYTDIVWLISDAFAIGWVERPTDGSDPIVKIQIFNADGTPRIEPATVVSGPAVGIDEIVALPTGGFMAVVVGSEGNYGQVINEDGTLTGGPFQAVVGDDNEMAILSNLNHVVVGSNFDGSGQGIFTRVMESTSVIINGFSQVNTETEFNQNSANVTALTTGGYVVVWTDNSPSPNAAIKAQIMNSVGQKIGGEILVSPPLDDDAEPDERSGLPDVAALPEGGFVVTWTQNEVLPNEPSGVRVDSSIIAQMFDADGVAVGDVIEVSADPDINESLPSITSFGDGTFVISWIDTRVERVPDPNTGGTKEATLKSVKAQAYDAEGGKIGDVMDISPDYGRENSTEGILTLSSSSSSNGELVIGWSTQAFTSEGRETESHAAIVIVGDDDDDDHNCEEIENQLSFVRGQIENQKVIIGAIERAQDTNDAFIFDARDTIDGAALDFVIQSLAQTGLALLSTNPLAAWFLAINEAVNNLRDNGDLTEQELLDFASELADTPEVAGVFTDPDFIPENASGPNKLPTGKTKKILDDLVDGGKDILGGAADVFDFYKDLKDLQKEYSNLLDQTNGEYLDLIIEAGELQDRLDSENDQLIDLFQDEASLEFQLEQCESSLM